MSEPTELRELERALRRHRTLLVKWLSDPQRESHDLYLPLAGVLRVLLCDAECPVLLRYSALRHVSLRIWGPSPPNKLGSPDALLVWSALIASWQPDPEGFEMDIGDYLATRIGVTSVPTPDGLGAGAPYTARQLIKWVANKEGVAHLEFRKPPALRSLNESVWSRGTDHVDAAIVRMAIYQIAEWAVHAIDAALAAPNPSAAAS